MYHEDVGYGVLENGKQKGPALDKVGDMFALTATHVDLTRELFLFQLGDLVQERGRDRWD